MPGEPTLLWDTSGLLLLGERGGARTWLATSARPMAFVARALAPEGGVAPTDPLTVSVAAERLPAVAAATAPGATQVHVAHVATTRVAAQVHSEAPRLLVMMIKHRPSLWHARVNGQSVASEVVDGLWTALVVPRGTSFVEMEAHLPIWVVLSAAAGLAGSVWLCLLGRPRAPRVMVGASP